MNDFTIIQTIAIWAIPTLFAITLHEVAHGWVASWFGDHTARLSGRLSLNPLKHVDLVGTVIVPLVMLVVSNFIFGWAKPVLVDARNLHHPRRDMAFVALAGPIANMAMAFFWGLIAKLGLMSEDAGIDWLGTPLFYMGDAGIKINLVLGVLNLIPLPPLDGGKVLLSLLPPRTAYYFSFVEPYSFFILIALMVTGILNWIIGPFLFIFINLIASVYNLI